MRQLLGIAAIALAGTLGSGAFAQETGEAVLFGQGGYRGAARSLAGPARFPTKPMMVRSLRIPPGSRWELCSGGTFTGCRQFSESKPALALTVRSARPVAAVLPAAASIAATGGAASLRGVASEFFVAPQDNGARVAVEGGTSEATMRSARDFCRARGWTQSAHARLQTVGTGVYLTDVLCVNE